MAFFPRLSLLLPAAGLCVALLLWGGCGGQDECETGEARCEDGVAVSCRDGQLARTACEEGTYCNYGECLETTVVFPRDAAFHNERSEWWYYTGHIGNGDNLWGFEITIFRYDIESTFGLDGFGHMCHVAVTDKRAGEHYHTDFIGIEPDVWQNDPSVALEVEYCRFEMDGEGVAHITGDIPPGKERDGKATPWRFDLVCEPQKPAARHGGDGIIPMSDSGGTSWYYSYTRMTAVGTLLTPDGEVYVNGQAWMDHQWGQFDIVDFKGWDWWSMQFDDNWEIMLFQFTDWDGNLAAQAGTLIDPAGNLTELEGMDAFTIVSQRTWQSTHTDGEYPLDWNIAIPAMDWNIEVRTYTDDQEMHNPVQNYWEGYTELSGTRGGKPLSGVGYTELTGYATDIMDPKR